MKKTVIVFVLTLFGVGLFAQQENDLYKEYLEALQNSMPQVEETDSALVMKFMKEEWEVKKGDEILIFLPAGGKTDYMFVHKKKGLINTKFIKAVSDIVGTTALTVGLGTKSLGTMIGTLEVMQKANAVYYGADALEQINNLKISKNAKSIAGKKAKVLGWKIADEDYVLNVKIGEKKYEVIYVSAILLNEIKLLTPPKKIE